MNKTRTEIIELIEPFMDKNFTEGCYILYPVYDVGYDHNGGNGGGGYGGETIYVMGKYINEDFLFYQDKMAHYRIYNEMDNEGKTIKKHYDEVNIDKDVYTERIEEKDVEKIYGHYDITAVLKYINDNGIYEVSISANGIMLLLNYGTQKEQYSFPNKPLNLYTEQEEKDLLKLLQKLNTKQ